ncbi:AAA family ATPase [Paenibacillus sp. FSL L8-0696]|uniref:AAA family ATPase n=1 Tax=Paenibacillus sp. FSL L8-0696 TaxID=2954524 RepID=UPI0031192B36
MIKKIILKNIATYNTEGITLNDLRHINFIYGNNGSGKTTLSEFIRKHEEFTSSSIEWEGSNKKICVYNRNFVKDNFLVGNPIKGIFTLGKESVEIQATIKEIREKVLQHNKDIANLTAKHNEKIVEDAELDTNFIKVCWKIKTKIDREFKDLIKGYRNSQEKFMLKCVEESKKTLGELKTLEEIKSRKENLYDRDAEPLPLLFNITYDPSLEIHSLFNTKIIGKEDVDIAELISQLQISDWVKQGHTISNSSNGICPFCQQQLPNLFEEKLNFYFDQTYEKQVNELQIAATKYLDHVQKIIMQIETLLSLGMNSFLDKDKLHNARKLIESIFKENKLLLEKKMKEPSTSIHLVGISDYIDNINSEIMISDGKIAEFNKLLENSKLEKANLIIDMWRYIVQLSRDDFIEYNKRKQAKQKEVEGLKSSISKKEEFMRGFERELIGYQQQITNVEHSVNEINKILNSFGFKNFRLAATSGEGNYKIIRENGDDANETLSEGEKTFITFLYFYQLLKGSNDINDIVTEKIVVIDDPISSLDSSVLFMVSSLVRQLMFDIKNNSTDIKQLFVLTHNIYFHKEITFNQGKKSYGEGTFWILRKNNNITSIESYSENPIKTSYELLWKELKNPINHHNVISMQNTMRRIIENYFKFFGNMNIDELEDKFDLEERLVCRSLISWLNDGSHSINEDLYVESGMDVMGMYMKVFRDVFVKSNHITHYDMMMKGYQISIEETQCEVSNEGRDEIASGLREVAVGINLTRT